MLTKIHLVKAMVFPVVMYGYESWTIKRPSAKELMLLEMWYWRTLLGIPWTARRFNQSILKEISPEYSLEGLMLKLKLQYFGHLMQRTDSLEKTDAGKGWRQEEKGMTGDEMVRWHHRLDGHEFEQALGVGDREGSLACCSIWDHKELGMNWRNSCHQTIILFSYFLWLTLNWSPKALYVSVCVCGQVPLSMGFSTQECWSGLPFPTPGNLPTQESNPHFLCFLHS